MIGDRRRLVVEGGTRIVDFDIKRYKAAPEEGVELAMEAMRSGLMFRYQPQEAELSLASRFERCFAQHLGMKYAIGVNSCGSALSIALEIAGVQPGDAVLSNAFTFVAVPSVLRRARAEAVLVEATREWGVDVEDLDRKATSSGAKVLLLSYMRGHVPDMDRLMEVVERHGLFLIEDCAHAFSTTWNSKALGTFGQIGCFSAQSSKGLSAGEGGVLVTNNDEYAVKAVLYSGGYEDSWKKHYSLSPEMIARFRSEIPCYSMRMSEVTAAILLPQVSRLKSILSIQTQNYQRLAEAIGGHEHIEIPRELPQVKRFYDTMQFNLIDLSRSEADRFINLVGLEGLSMQIFGAKQSARDFRQWAFLNTRQKLLPQTVSNIEFACDLSLQPHLTTKNIDVLAQVICEVLDFVVSERTGVKP